MSTHNTHYPTTQNTSQKKSRFASALPVPVDWIFSSDLNTIKSFDCFSVSSSVPFSVRISFLDGSYFFWFRDSVSLRYVTSCSFASLRNALLGFRATAKSLQWTVDFDKK